MKGPQRGRQCAMRGVAKVSVIVIRDEHIGAEQRSCTDTKRLDRGYDQWSRGGNPLLDSDRTEIGVDAEPQVAVATEAGVDRHPIRPATQLDAAGNPGPQAHPAAQPGPRGIEPVLYPG